MTNCIWLLAAIVFVGTPSDRTILYFSSSNCPACRKIQPTIDQLNTEGWAIRSIDSSRDSASADKWRVHQIPTVIVLENGREVDRVIGSVEHSELKRRLTSASSNSLSRSSNRLQALYQRLHYCQRVNRFKKINTFSASAATVGTNRLDETLLSPS